ncbi:hypothetical protein C8R46DRAFT_1042474 [Mycena filopes]|nr:hypothetical protein C8R46DRAFT_1042474 [Mycena filopes]
MERDPDANAEGSDEEGYTVTVAGDQRISSLPHVDEQHTPTAPSVPYATNPRHLVRRSHVLNLALSSSRTPTAPTKRPFAEVDALRSLRQTHGYEGGSPPTTAELTLCFHQVKGASRLSRTTFGGQHARRHRARDSFSFGDPKDRSCPGGLLAPSSLQEVLNRASYNDESNSEVVLIPDYFANGLPEVSLAFVANTVHCTIMERQIGERVKSRMSAKTWQPLYEKHRVEGSAAESADALGTRRTINKVPSSVATQFPREFLPTPPPKAVSVKTSHLDGKQFIFQFLRSAKITSNRSVLPASSSGFPPSPIPRVTPADKNAPPTDHLILSTLSDTRAYQPKFP